MPIKQSIARMAAVLVLSTSAVTLHATAAQATRGVSCEAYGDSVEIYVNRGYPYRYCFRDSGSMSVDIYDVSLVKSGRYTLTYQYRCNGSNHEVTLSDEEYRTYGHCGASMYIPKIWIS